MDLEARKYHFIKELFSVDSESVIDALERVLKTKKEELKDNLSIAQKEELDRRLGVYKMNPDDTLDWEKLKSNW